MLIRDIKPLDVLNGTGTRTSIWLAGCDHQCPGCFAKNTWTWTGHTEEEMELRTKIRIYMTDQRIRRDGISILGGDPLYHKNRKGLYQFLKWFKEEFPNKTVWLWTGFTLEECQNDGSIYPILPFIDVLVDGKFEQDKKDPDLKFRGSSNQRVIEL